MSTAGGTGDPTPGFNVEVEGGQGAVIGQGNIVYQTFAQAPTPLSSLIRVAAFRPLVEERTRHFVGREFVFDALDRHLSDREFPSGYVVIQGEPGIGKTAISAQLVARHGYVHHFNIATQAIRSKSAFLSNACAQLIVRYGLRHTVLPPQATEDSGFLVRLLAEAAEKHANRPVVVVVDALDEADDVGLGRDTNRLALPPTTPEGAYFVVTTRQQYDYHLLVEPRRDIYIRDDDPHNVQDIRTYLAAFIEANREQLDARIAEWGTTPDGFVEIMVGKSEGNFMYLVQVLRDIRDGRLTARTIGNIRKLPQGLRDYYRRHWTTMRAADEDFFRFYQEPVICLLGTAQEPVAMDRILSWTLRFWARRGWDHAAFEARRVRDVVIAWQEFLNVGETETGDPLYRVYHASFQDFLREEVGLAEYHDTISDAALAKIPGFLDGP